MCGIVGYVGNKDALPILLESLKKLEYRGYDSSGVGFLDHNAQLIVRKSKGKIRNLEERLHRRPLPFAHVGISHTRWATHGFPSDKNAHPHRHRYLGSLPRVRYDSGGVLSPSTFIHQKTTHYFRD